LKNPPRAQNDGDVDIAGNEWVPHYPGIGREEELHWDVQHKDGSHSNVHPEESSSMRFVKMHGCGNDYVYIDCFKQPIPADPPALSRTMSDRHFGIGSDGLILICPSDKADARMKMYNADGSEGEMCGNGVRCIAKYLYDHGVVRKEKITLETGRGILVLEPEVKNGKVSRVRVDMGEPILAADRIPTTLPGNPPIDVPLQVGECSLPVTCVSMGNPHCVHFADSLTDALVLVIGPKIEKHPAFPRRVNVEFVHINRRDDIALRVWERGSGETQACGTGACAAVVAGVVSKRLDRRVTAHLLGGDLELHWSESDNHVYMTGPAVEVFQGEWPENVEGGKLATDSV
jgi:diaminopimelate epimerase